MMRLLFGAEIVRCVSVPSGSRADDPLSTEKKDTKKQKKMLKIMPTQKEQEKFQNKDKKRIKSGWPTRKHPNHNMTRFS